MAVAAMQQSSLPCSVDHYIERVHQDAARTQPVQLRCDLPPFHRRTHLERQNHTRVTWSHAGRSSTPPMNRRPQRATNEEPGALGRTISAETYSESVRSATVGAVSEGMRARHSSMEDFGMLALSPILSLPSMAACRSRAIDSIFSLPAPDHVRSESERE